jgi:hypothetical protein
MNNYVQVVKYKGCSRANTNYVARFGSLCVLQLKLRKIVSGLL